MACVFIWFPARHQVSLSLSRLMNINWKEACPPVCISTVQNGKGDWTPGAGGWTRAAGPAFLLDLRIRGRHYYVLHMQTLSSSQENIRGNISHFRDWGIEMPCDLTKVISKRQNHDSYAQPSWPKPPTCCLIPASKAKPQSYLVTSHLWKGFL